MLTISLYSSNIDKTERIEACFNFVGLKKTAFMIDYISSVLRNYNGKCLYSPSLLS